MKAKANHFDNRGCRYFVSKCRESKYRRTRYDDPIRAAFVNAVWARLLAADALRFEEARLCLTA